jgi:glycosyltransferase involved in cell wall biosynthesis
MYSSMSESFVSVVTPFHNTAEYLAQCIESVLAQTHSNFEYLLIDNQSKDESLAIAERYAKTDSRIQVIRTERLLPQVENYNSALNRISPQSKYVKIVQADDWIYPRCLSEMVALANERASIALVSAYELKHTVVEGSCLPPERRIISGREACRLYLLNDFHMFGSPTTVLYSADVVRARKPFYDLDRLHEDTEVVFEILKDRDFGFVHQVLTFTRVQEQSLSASIRDFLTQKLDQLVVAKRYGEVYLSPEEHRESLEHKRAQYYRAVARRWIKEHRGKLEGEFWEYQRRGLATIGETVRPELIAQHLAPAIAEAVLSTKLLRKLQQSG